MSGGELERKLSTESSTSVESVHFEASSATPFPNVNPPTVETSPDAAASLDLMIAAVGVEDSDNGNSGHR